MEIWNLFPAVLGVIIIYRYRRMREVLGKEEIKVKSKQQIVPNKKGAYH